MRYLNTLVVTATFISAMASAHNISIGQPLPAVSVDNYGELTLNGDEIGYQPWASDKLTGKVRIVQAIAGRSSAKKMIEPLVDAITAAKFPQDKYQTMTIINQDDAMWGTGSFVKSSAEDSKTEFHWSSFILDANGSVANAWGLRKENAAVIVVDSQGQVKFIKEGELNNKDVIQIISLIRDMVR